MLEASSLHNKTYAAKTQWRQNTTARESFLHGGLVNTKIVCTIYYTVINVVYCRVILKSIK